MPHSDLLSETARISSPARCARSTHCDTRPFREMCEETISAGPSAYPAIVTIPAWVMEPNPYRTRNDEECPNSVEQNDRWSWIGSHTVASKFPTCLSCFGLLDNYWTTIKQSNDRKFFSSIGKTYMKMAGKSWIIVPFSMVHPKQLWHCLQRSGVRVSGAANACPKNSSDCCYSEATSNGQAGLKRLGPLHPGGKINHGKCSFQWKLSADFRMACQHHTEVILSSWNQKVFLGWWSSAASATIIV